MPNISGNQCPIIQRLQNEGRCVSFAVVSKKHNQPERKLCPVSHVAVKRLNLEGVTCEKLEQYARENRLVVIARDETGPVIFLKNGKNCYSDAPSFIRYVDKSSSSDATCIEKELLKVVVEELSDEEYAQFCTFCISTATDYSQASDDQKKGSDAANSQAAVYSEDFTSLKKDQFIRSILNQLNDIIDRHFEIIREARDEEDQQRKAAEKSELRRRDDISYQERLRYNRKEQEKKGVAKTDLGHHLRDHEEKKNSIRQANGGLPVSEHIS